jgi:hypothetical protein
MWKIYWPNATFLFRELSADLPKSETLALPTQWCQTPIACGRFVHVYSGQCERGNVASEVLPISAGPVVPNRVTLTAIGSERPHTAQENGNPQKLKSVALVKSLEPIVRLAPAIAGW